ncbi:MAG TPA: hypothetical protein VMW11_07460 [Candidatus Dormibacteraeota bacterium]|nr:hypothetical protein [Candidatus Dormibacteraeota bacterium]
MRALALVIAIALFAAACARSSSSGANASPIDLYAAEPSQADVQSLLGESNWWPGPPSYGVRPLDSASMPFQERFHVVQRFSHIGTAETLDVEFTLWNSTATATTQMTNFQSAFGTSASGPKVGDQVLYYGSQTSTAAPFESATFVRVGQIVTTISLNRKDAFPSTSQLGKVATKIVSRLKDVLAGKIKTSPPPSSDSTLLPPAGPDMTFLGSARLPVEAVVVMLGFASPEVLAGILHGDGVDTMVFGDYVLDADTHMEMRAGLLDFSTTQEADDWITALRGTASVDANGLSTFYDDGSGQYFSVFSAGTKGAMLVCRSTSDLEAASRSCEAPLSRVGPAWQLSLQGG